MKDDGKLHQEGKGRCKIWIYRLTDPVSYHRAVHTDEHEPLLPIVDDERSRKRSKMESRSLLIDLRVAHLEIRTVFSSVIRIQKKKQHY